MIGEDGAKRPDSVNIEEVIKAHVREFIENGKLLGKNGLAIGSGGNMSVKVPGGMLITSTGSSLDNLKPEEIIFVVSADGDNVYFVGPVKPSSETVNHWVVYQERPDIGAISHVNVGPKDSKNIITTKEEMPYGTIELGYDVAAMLRNADAVMLKNHGVMAVGRNLTEATELLIESTDRKKRYIFGPI